MRPDSIGGYHGRTYRFYTGEVVYTFGGGLSYSEFKYHLIRAPRSISIPIEEGHIVKMQVRDHCAKTSSKCGFQYPSKGRECVEP